MEEVNPNAAAVEEVLDLGDLENIFSSSDSESDEQGSDDNNNNIENGTGQENQRLGTIGDDFRKMTNLLNKFATDKNKLQVQNSKLKVKLMEARASRKQLDKELNEREEACKQLEERVEIYESKCLFLRTQVLNELKCITELDASDPYIGRPLKKLRLDGSFKSSAVEHVGNSSGIRKEDPMQNDVILKNVMKYLPVNALINCRRTCKQWDRQARPYLVKTSTIEIDSSNVCLLQEDLATLIQKPDATLFTNFKFSTFQVDDHLCDIVLFLSYIGTFIKSLTLHFHDEELSLEQLRNMFLTALPNLEVLRLTALSCELMNGGLFEDEVVRLRKLQEIQLRVNCDCDLHHFSYEWIRDLLLLAPHLIKLDVAPYDSYFNLDNVGITVAKALASSAESTNLRYLSLDYPLRQEGTTKLIETNNFNFQELLLRDVTSEALPFLEKQTQLSQLSLLANEDNWVDGPTLKKLSCLNKLNNVEVSFFERQEDAVRKCYFKIERDYTQNSTVVLDSVCVDSTLLESEECLDNGSLFPSNLICPPTSSGPAEQNLEPVANQVYKTVKKVTLRFQTTEEDPILHCIQLFPNVQILRIAPMEKIIMHQIWKFLTGLTELNLHLPVNIGYDFESGIIGISSSLCNMLRNDPVVCSLMGVFDTKILEFWRNDESICRLTKLQKLVISIDGPEHLTDLTIELALLKMDSLHSVTINRFRGTELALKALKMKLPKTAELCITRIAN